MAHNLEVINGKASFAYANGRPGWHGLGQAIPPGMEHSETVAELAGLNRRVVLTPLYTIVDGEPVAVPQKFATAYEDTGFVLGVVGNRYTVVQNVAAFNAIDRWLSDGRVRYETAGALDEGRKVFILVRIDEDFTIAGADPVTPYALVTNSHDGSSGLGVKLVSTRVVCANTLNIALREKGERIGIRHTASAEANIESAAKALGLVARQQRETMERFEQLAQMNAGQDIVEQVIDLVAPDPATITVDLTDRQRNRAVRRHESFMTMLQHAKELPTIASAGGLDNRWGLFNAASEWMEWVDPTKSTQILERRMVGSLEGGVAAARQKVYDLVAAV
ncbi:MAG: hypothetical protein C3F10_11940 [Dehalococcoidia bacterium]|nr:MAG: hypothetical protein C3F10_11940 [Dehalococcoidia bacterium]